MENPRTRYVEWRGERRRLIDLAREHGLLPSTVWHRCRAGWSLEDAILTPARDGCPRRTVEWQGRQRTLIDLAREYGLKYETLYDRLREGLPLAQALTPARCGRPPSVVSWQGKERRLDELAREHGHKPKTVLKRMKSHGLSLEAALKCGRRGNG